MSEAKKCFNKKPTLCWDCANYAHGCSWSENLIPVKGWTAVPIHGKVFDTYHVDACPLFERDAYNGGAIRIKDYVPGKKRVKETIFDVDVRGTFD